MPPPAADPDCRDYEGSDRMVLPDEKKAMIREWVDGDAPMGDEASEVVAEEIDLTLPDANMELLMEHAYTPSFDDPDNPVQIALSRMNDGAYPMSHGITRMHARFLGDDERVSGLLETPGVFEPEEADEEHLDTIADIVTLVRAKLAEA